MNDNDTVTISRALLPTCPTCGGKGLVDGFGAHDDTIPMRCPANCVDGKVSIEQLAATWRAVWGFEMRELQWGDEYDAGAQAAIEQIRETRP